MAYTDNVAMIERKGDPALVTRIIGWGTLGALAAFLIDNILMVGFDFQPPWAALSGDSTALATALVYVALIGLGVIHVLRSPTTALRWDAERINRANLYIVRSLYFGVLLVGIFDIAISFMRVEHIFDMFLSGEWVRRFERPDFVGLYVHIPLFVIGFVWGAFSRTLGIPWLALLVIVAELMIVIARFVFSYEQAFMGDLVRYWYSALFLMASAYTLHEEGHVRVDILYAGLQQRVRGVINTWGTLLLGMPTAWVILAVSFAGKHSIINSPVMNFEVSQTGSIGLFVKYQMAAFLGIFAATMLIQFVCMLFEAVADSRGEPGHRETHSVEQ